MRRWTLTITTVLLVAVWLASAWWPHIWRSDVKGRVDPQWIVLLAGGRVEVDRVNNLDAYFPGLYPLGMNPAQPLMPMRWWFEWQQYAPGDYLHLAIPLWAPALLCAVPAARAWRSRIRFLRGARKGACPPCGYDLSGLPTGNGTTTPTCPECGA